MTPPNAPSASAAPLAARHGPDAAASLAQYKHRSAWYDLELIAFEPIRRIAIERLKLASGQTVMDVGCGTGLSLPLLARAVAPNGQVVGIEPSAEMLAHAAAKLGHDVSCVRLVLSTADSADVAALPMADAMLLHFTHDVLRNPAAVSALMRQVKPGGTVVAAGLQWAPLWAPAANLFVWSAALYSTTCLEGLSSPCDSLRTYLDDLVVEPQWAGAVYIATGRRNGTTA